MLKIALIASALIFICLGQIKAQEPETFEQAQEFSSEQGKPLLLEFFREH